MKINLFAALPAAQSASARWTREFAPMLARHADLILWSHERGWEAEVEAHAEVRLYGAGQPPWGEFNRASLTVFHLGDDVNAFGPIWTISRRHPGIVILHKAALQPLLLRLLAEERFLTVLEYLALAELHHPRVGRTACEWYLRGAIDIDELTAQCPLIGAATANALAVIVDSRDAFARVSQQAACPVHLIPASSPATTAASYLDQLLAVLGNRAEYDRIWSGRVMSRRVGEAIAGWCTRSEALDRLPRIVEEIALLNRAAHLP